MQHGLGGVILQSKSLILSVENLSVGYHETLVSGINLDLHVGEIIAVVGPSGIGKTTILRTVAGLVKPISGKIDCNTPKRGGIGYIPQKLGLVRHTSVYHNVDIGARSGARLFPEPSTWFKRRHERVLNAIDRMGLREKISEPVRRLSGGQQRRVATARTLAQKPKLILADEFLSELDDDNISIVLDAVREYMEESKSAMILVEHNIQRASEISDRLLKVENGKLVDFKFNETTTGLKTESEDEVIL